MIAPQQTLDQFAVTAPEFITKTAIATVWKVQTNTGKPAALKLYHKPDMGAEKHGFTVMKALNGTRAAKVYATSTNASLTEWLHGPSLGDLSRSGQDEVANKELVTVASAMHKAMPKPIANLPNLRERFQALATLGFAPDCPATARQNLQTCQSLA